MTPYSTHMRTQTPIKHLSSAQWEPTALTIKMVACKIGCGNVRRTLKSYLRLQRRL